MKEICTHQKNLKEMNELRNNGQRERSVYLTRRIKKDRRERWLEKNFPKLTRGIRNGVEERRLKILP